MKVGITYDLRTAYLDAGYTEEETAEFDKETTIDNIEETLISLGYETQRIGNIKDLVNNINTLDCDIIFNICEGMYGTGRESQVPALLDAYQIPYTFSEPSILYLTLDKAMTKQIISHFGISTPKFVVFNNEKDILDYFTSPKLSYPLFVKPNSEGSGKGITDKSKVNNASELWKLCKNIWSKEQCKLIVEEYLPGREFTIGIVGTGDESFSLGCMEIIFNGSDKNYSYNMKTNYKDYITYTVPENIIAKKVCDLALKTWKILECRDAGRIDIRLDKNNEPNFIEVNPLAGLNKDTSDLPILAGLNGYNYEYIIKNIMESAKKRIVK